MARKYKERNAKAWADKVRDKIQADKLVDRLMRFALGQLGPQGETIKLEPSQVKAAQILLAKIMPDLTAADITNHEPEQSLEQKFRALVNQVGEKQARAIYPDIADRFLGPVQTHEQPSVTQ